MGTAILHNRVIKKGVGMPEYTFDGTHTVIDDGSESGIWQIGLTSTGTLTLASAAKGITVKAQGGGGSGGASDGTTDGSDGYDGAIASYEGDLAAGDYSVAIGAGGSAPTNAKGNSGGKSSFANIAIANGGAGGALGGDVSRTHTGLYSTYGHGGAGGEKWNYTSTYKHYVSGEGAKLYTSGLQDSGLTLPSGKFEIENATYGGDKYKIISGTYAGYYVYTSEVTKTSEESSRKYYGTSGRPGIVIISGKV